MSLKRLLVLSMLLMLCLTGCTTQSSEPQAVAVNRPAVPTPASGKSVLVGQATGSNSQTPITKTYVYLAKVFWDKDHTKAAYALDLGNSPVATTDQNGFFTFNQLDPSEYVIVVGDYYGSNDVVREKNGDAKIYMPEAGKPLDVGTIQVNPAVQMKS